MNIIDAAKKSNKITSYAMRHAGSYLLFDESTAQCSLIGTKYGDILEENYILSKDDLMGIDWEIYEKERKAIDVEIIKNIASPDEVFEKERLLQKKGFERVSIENYGVENKQFWQLKMVKYETN